VARKLFVILLALSFFVGCSRELRFYPVQGPQSAKTPVPIFVGKMTGALNSGNLSLALSDGEVCKGHWAQVRLPEAKSAPSATVPTSSEMAAVWDTVYGQGFYVSHVLGTQHFAQSTLNGNKGTTMNVELFAIQGSRTGELPDIKGVAKDSKENIYKVVQ
jgi:hypothetical protein